MIATTVRPLGFVLALLEPVGFVFMLVTLVRYSWLDDLTYLI